MRVDSELTGVLIAVGFLVMGFVSMPIAALFIVGAIGLGVVVALLLRFAPKKFIRVLVGTVITLVVGTVIIVAAVGLWWGRHKSRQLTRPSTVSSNALYILPDKVPLRWHKKGYWLECWFERHADVDRCRLMDENGTDMFEDVFLPCAGKEPIRSMNSKGQRQWTGEIWSRSPDKGIRVPIVYVYGKVLLPQSFYEEAKRDIGCPPL